MADQQAAPSKDLLGFLVVQVGITYISGLWQAARRFDQQRAECVDLLSIPLRRVDR